MWNVYKMGADGCEFKITTMTGDRDWVQDHAMSLWGPLVYLRAC